MEIQSALVAMELKKDFVWKDSFVCQRLRKTLEMKR